MGLGHPASVRNQYRDFGPLALNSTTNAGLVAVSDAAKKHWVDRLLNFEGAPAYPVPSPGPSPVPLSVDSDGFGMSGGEVQVLEPENIQEPENVQEPGDVQAPEDIRGSENVQGPEGIQDPVGVQDSEGIVSGEEKFSGADGVSWDEDVDPVEGSDVDFVGGE